MLESAVVIATDGRPLYWHLPAQRSPTSLPDSRVLWEVLWQHRDVLAGVAHTHPGWGTPQPSWTDLTTFAACEDGLGQRLRWWIATASALRCFMWRGPHPYRYAPVPTPTAPSWLGPLRANTDYTEEKP